MARTFCPWLGLFPLLAFISSAAAQNFQLEERIGVRGLSPIAARGKSLDELPAGLRHETGRISVIADFDKAKNNRISVYLVNASSQVCEIDTIAYELPLFLEAQIGPDLWERAEPHQSYGIFSRARRADKIEPGTFRARVSRHWTEGESARLRYALYQNGRAVFASEAFDGWLPAGQIHESRRDVIAMQLIPSPLRIRYEPDITTLGEVRRDWLGKIELLHTLGPCYNELEQAQLWAAFIHQNPVASGEERDLAIAIQRELLREWPLQYDFAALLEKCLLVAEKDPSENTALRPLCWRVLGESAGARFAPPRVSLLAPRAFLMLSNPSASPAEKEACVDFLCLTTVSDLHSPLRDLKNHDQLLYAEKNPYIRLAMANWLMRKRQVAQLGKGILVKEYYAANQDEVSVYELVKYLHFERLYQNQSSASWDLWQKALERDPAAAFPQMAMMFEGSGSDLFDNKLSRKDLPEFIEEQLETFYDAAPGSALGRMIRKFLDIKEKKENPPFIPVF